MQVYQLWIWVSPVQGLKNQENSYWNRCKNEHFQIPIIPQLELHGIEPAQETDCDADSVFLMEIMEINEKLAESKSDGILEEIDTLIKGRL